MQRGGQLGSVGPEHWMVSISTDMMYQSGEDDQGLNSANVTCGNKSSQGCHLAGVTKKTNTEIRRWVATWNSTGGGSQKYDLLTNSCQTFASKFAHWLCDGQCSLPPTQGARTAVGQGYASADVGGVGAHFRPNDKVQVGVHAVEASALALARDYTAKAEAKATLAKGGVTATSGFKPLDKHLTAGGNVLSAGAGGEASLETWTLSASAGTHLAEANAGPFAVRAGVKFGGGVEGGIPVVHAGPVSAPCSVM